MGNLRFEDLNISEQIRKGIREMGFEEATPVQSQGIPLLLEGADVIAQAPTGTGKTCAFGIPLIQRTDPAERAVQGLVLCPTRELAVQITGELQNIARFCGGVRIVPVYGGQPIERQIEALRRKPQIIVATPGRMMDHLRRRTIRLDRLKMAVLDEADEMLNMGFREDIDTILEGAPSDRQTVLFSATVSPEIREIADTYQRDAQLVQVTRREVTVPNIEQYYAEVRASEKMDALARLMDANGYRLAIVFCDTKRAVDELTAGMSARGWAAEALHGDMKQSQRDRVMDRFRRRAVSLLVATDVAARGIDVENVEAVFNYDVPGDDEYYVHRIGRTGRNNRKGAAYTLVTRRELYRLREIMRYTKAEISPAALPSAADVEELRVRRRLEEAKEAVASGAAAQYEGYLQKMLEEGSADGAGLRQIAAALLALSVGGSRAEEPAPEKSRERRGKKPAAVRKARPSADPGPEPGMVRLSFNIGTENRVEARDMVRLIAGESGLPGREIGKISIYGRHAFAEVPEGACGQVEEALSGKRYRGRVLAVEHAGREKRFDRSARR
ncbi:MAG: DEAD/DEAH box helicase [Oscillospiraceae bacterium]|nr:DEAD/DEAH box helicase [Oscillospiraceae bacterium]